MNTSMNRPKKSIRPIHTNNQRRPQHKTTIHTTEGGARSRTLLAGGVVDPQAEEGGPLAAQQGDVPRGQVQLEHRGVHVLRPEDGVPVVGDPEWMVELLAVVHHLRTHTRAHAHTHTRTSAHVYAVCGSDGNDMRQPVMHLIPRRKGTADIKPRARYLNNAPVIVLFKQYSPRL